MLGFAVVDLETTGLFAGGHDRVIEVAVVQMDVTGAVTARWESLVNPGRDLGAQRIHGVRAEQIVDAPTFADIAPTVAALLSGRVVIAHNARFDVGFLRAEYDRLGQQSRFLDVAECTMLLAKDFLPGVGRSLADCCDACGIALTGAHRASVDAAATADLLAIFLALEPDFWGSVLSRTSGEHVRREPGAHPGYSREDAGTVLELETDFLARLVDRLPDVSGPDEHHVYLALLDRCLLDRRLSAIERRQLVGTADALGIGRDIARRLHADYFAALVAEAWADGVLTTAEIADLATVARVLSLDAALVSAALTAPPASLVTAPITPQRASLEAGMQIVLTGEMTRPRDAWHALLIGRGVIPKPAVTKSVAVVVAADPDSLSGKARKARDYGIPVVGEDWLVQQVTP